MPKFVEYELDENTTVLIEAHEEVDGIVKASRGDVDIIKSGKKFSSALISIRAQAAILLREINALDVDEAEVKFGITTVGEIGNMAIGKMGMGVNYEVTLRWKKKPSGTEITKK